MIVYTTHIGEASAPRTTHTGTRYVPSVVRDRGMALDAPGWWLDLARSKVSAHRGLVELGQQLARLAGRSTPWSHTVLSKFASGESRPTQELALAISEFFAIPRPFYTPSTLQEAELFQGIAQLRADGGADALARIHRARVHEAQLDDLEGEARQTSGVQPQDAGSVRSRRGPRSAHRGG